MPICVVIFDKLQEVNELHEKLQNCSTALKVQLIKPNNINKEDQSKIDNEFLSKTLKTTNINNVKLLNPKIDRSLRQKTMAFWLMPFGFITGLAFTKMTGLKTFSNLGFDPIAEPLIGSLLGMGSGWIGSYVAAGSVNPDTNNDLEIIQKRNKEGLWLLLIETPFEIELPWGILKDSNNLQIMRLNLI